MKTTPRMIHSVANRDRCEDYSMTTKTQNLLTTGKLCEVLQALPGQAMAAAQRAGVLPAICVNGRQTHWDEDDVERIRAALSPTQGTRT